MPRSRRAGCLLLLLGLVLLVGWAVYLTRAGLSLGKHLVEVQAIVDAGTANRETICASIEGLRGDVLALRRGTGGLVRLAPALGWLPQVGSSLRAAPDLLVVADSLTEAGAILCDAFETVPGAEAGGSAESYSLEQMGALLVEHKADLERSLESVIRAQEAWGRMNARGLSPVLEDRLSLLQDGLPLIRAGLETALVAPELLGFRGPRTYLVLAQNEDEMRPTGGFIGSVGLLTLDSGRVEQIEFSDAYFVDDYLSKPYPDPPAPLYEYMGAEVWLFRDSNWSPDFPTAARQAAHFYEYGQGVSVDGVIAVDQRAVELLLAGLGEVYVPEAGEVVTADNVRAFMRAAWNPPEGRLSMDWALSRKEFVGSLAAAVLERLESNPEGVDWIAIVSSVHRALHGRHLLFYVDDAEAAEAMAGLNWDGALRASDGDYLMVVDADIGFSKVQPLIEESVDYRVTLYAGGGAGAELSLTYAHQGRREGVSCVHQLPSSEDWSYEEVMHHCYYDYLRVYVPDDSELRAALPYPTPGEYLVRGEPADGRAVVLGEEAGKVVIAQFFVVEYGRTQTVRFLYDLPQVARESEEGWRYLLLLQKQPGSDDHPVSVTVTLPPGTQLVAANPAPSLVDGSVLGFSTVLDADLLIEVVYK